uniref:Cupin domain-containing protein n=1 Tax=candidate division WOR-3 bacterium TaxID=2052148 RepID=A0A7C4GCE8_UNCW3
MVKGRYTDVKAEPATLAGAQATIRWLIAKKEGAPNFAMRVIELAHKGDRIPLHRHSSEHEIFVFEGKGRLLQPGGESPVETGDFVYVAPEEEHGFENLGEGPFRFICVIPLPE